MFARGVRNGTGLAVAPDGALWTAVNNRDNIRFPHHRDFDGDGRDDYGRRMTAYVNQHPLEPLARLTQGRDLGRPCCNPGPDVQPGVRTTAYDLSERPLVHDVEPNANGSKLDCTALAPVEQGLPAHSAPLGLSFTRRALPGVGSGALVGVHGSWNRIPPREPSTSATTSPTRSTGGPPQGSDGTRGGRPVAAVQGADGAEGAVRLARGGHAGPMSTRRLWRSSALVSAGLLLAVSAGCSTSPAAEPSSAPTTAAAGSARLATVDLAVPGDLAASPLDEPRTVQAPAGWSVSVFARTDAARLLAWSPDGRLLVSRPKAGAVEVVTPPAGGGTGSPTTAPLLGGLNQPHGLAFHDGRLYVAQSDRVDAYAYADGRVSDPQVVVEGLPDAKSADLRGAYAHALKSVAVGEDGAVYVSVGSTGNISEEDRDANPQRATILRVPPGGGKAEVFARGVRNGTGLAVAPDGAVWTAVNNRDNIAYPYDRDFDGDGASDLGEVLPSYVGDHPLEPLARLTQGRDLGWPYCNPDPDVDPGVPGTALDYSDRAFVRDVQTNADGSKLDCSTLPPVEQGIGAHSAPLGLSFTTEAGLPAPYGAGALVGIHGSWNRSPPRAPEVAFFPSVAESSGADGLGDQQTLLTGFQSADGDRWGRPVAAVQGPDGAVYVSDDSAGAVYRMQPPA